MARHGFKVIRESGQASAYGWAEKPTPFLSPFLFAEAAGNFDVQLSYTTCGLRRMRRELDAGRPVVVLVHYGSIPTRQNVRFTGAQYLIVVGWERNKFFIHNSNWYDSKAGCLMEISGEYLYSAYGPEGAYNIGEPPLQALFLPERKQQSRNRTCAPNRLPHRSSNRTLSPNR